MNRTAPVPDVRALAARALARIVGGESLRAAYAHAAPTLADARDRALLSSLLHEGARWWLRFDAACDLLLERPLREREPQLQALIVLALVQLEVLQMPAYAVVAASVDATRALRRPTFANLVNAVLRRWQRERGTLLPRLDADLVARSAHPRWLIDALGRSWPAQRDALLAADNARAPLWLRVNRRRTDASTLRDALQAAGHDARLDAALPDAVVLADSTDVTALPGYAQGAFSVQDGAAQHAARLLGARDGERVLDACAAPGGKTAHILETADVDLVALDADAQRLPRLRDNLTRLGLAATVLTGDAAAPASWWDGKPFARILLDAPCSATGIVRRQPDIKLHRRASDLPALVAMQAGLLASLWPLLAPGGRLVYATCSVLAEENTRQIDTFLDTRGDALLRDAGPPGWHRGTAGAQNLPGEGAMDGFFYAVIDKAA